MPCPQDNLQRATELAFSALAKQKTDQILWLGAYLEKATWRLPVLNDYLKLDLSSRRVTTSADREISPVWRILSLHYLAVHSQTERLDPEVVFSDLPAARTYAKVYHQRVIARLCATAGRDAEKFRTASVGLGGQIASGGDMAFDFDVFPRLRIRIIWHKPDEEFPASATLLLPTDIESFFCIEDIVVLSECLVARLGGRGF